MATAQLHDASLDCARSECVGALFKVLGSDAFRKDEEISLSVGEALATYASAFASSEDSMQLAVNEWPGDLDEDFAAALDPPPQVCLASQSVTMSSFWSVTMLSFRFSC